MTVYIVRRLVAAIVLLLIVTAACFVIFFLVPRLGGASAEDLASRYVGKTADAATIHDIAVKLGFTEPVYVQYGRFLKGIVAGADYPTGPTMTHCPAPCFGYSFLTQNPRTARHPRPAARHHLARRGRRGDLGRRRGGLDRCAVGTAARQLLRPRRHGRLARRRLAADLLHRPADAVDLQLRPRHHRARRQLHTVRAEPGTVGLRPAAAVDHPRVPLRRRLRPAHPRRDARHHGGRTSSAPRAPRACPRGPSSSNTA